MKEERKKIVFLPLSYSLNNTHLGVKQNDLYIYIIKKGD